MTLFEYLAVSVAIVLSFGVIRLLDGLPAALAKEQRYWIHALWVVNLLWMHIQVWWAFWSYHGQTSWNYPRFILALAPPGLLYSLAITLIPRNAHDVRSWSSHFHHVRVRFCTLFALLVLALGLSTWLVLELPLLLPLRAWQAALVVFLLLGARFSAPRFQGALAIGYFGLLVYSVVAGFFQPAPLLAG